MDQSDVATPEAGSCIVTGTIDCRLEKSTVDMLSQDRVPRLELNETGSHVVLFSTS